MAVLSIAVDPFWIWQRDPHWLITNDGKNLNLDRRMRQAKTLQLFTRPTDLVVIGSSKVTRGFDLSHGYNLGIASLHAAEMEGYIRHLLRWRTVDTLVIGLDYAMFDAQSSAEEGYVPTITRSAYAPEAALATLFSRDALSAARMARAAQPDTVGRWHWNGYEEMPSYSAEACRKLAHAIAADHAMILPPDDAAYAAFDRSLMLANHHGTRTFIYLAPMPRSVREGIAMAEKWPEVQRWQARVKEIAVGHGISVYDFTEAPLADDTILLRSGSTEYWYEPSHFTAKTGAWILGQMGIK